VGRVFLPLHLRVRCSNVRKQSYDTIMWDAVLRHAKFTIGFLVEASYL